MNDPASTSPGPARDAVLRTASQLFYREGVRAVGMELIVERSGVAKTTIYRHFPTKDALVEAFLEAEDREFWQQWDKIVASSAGEPRNALLALSAWVGGRVSRDGYRGCPQINVAAEFADAGHPARIVAHRHKAEMVTRLAALCRELDASTADLRAQQIGLLFDGAFMSGARLGGLGAKPVLDDAIERLIQGPDVWRP
ncbi:TetR/AcrR family transcriptional regulator [Sphingomonas hankookensis]|uniref:TetR/AcrR family transcriptional regulator n=1 Tax=Sphingomonas hankookensis TaxID=563996 RepID=UPI001F5968B5|nr:TetR/AcrR family transcriptional regulator [Sphingomonas hankookensis]